LEDIAPSRIHGSVKETVGKVEHAIGLHHQGEAHRREGILEQQEASHALNNRNLSQQQQQHYQ